MDSARSGEAVHRRRGLDCHRSGRRSLFEVLISPVALGRFLKGAVRIG